MPAELSLVFPDCDHVQVSLQRGDKSHDSPLQPFVPPLDPKTRQELGWYLETYPVRYTTDLDDERASGIAERLKHCGEALFNAVFADPAARRLFNRFQDIGAEDRLLTIRSLHPTILAQPWELLRDPGRTFLFLDHPRISIRRRLPDQEREPYRPKPKNKLHLLFVVCRPTDEGFLDPRADPMAVMDALDTEAPGRISVEFLRPPTLNALIDRMNDDRKPPIDILHFDGHGAYDPDGRLSDRASRAIASAGAEHLMRDGAAAAHHGYLSFEDDTGKSDRVPAAKFGDLLQSKRVGLVILSACQSAMVSGEDALGSVAPRLIHAGIPSVLAMTQSVLVATTRALCRHFYRNLAAGRPIGAALDAARTQLYADSKRDERRRSGGTVAFNLQDWFVPALYQADADGALLKRATGAAAVPAAPADNLEKPKEAGFHGRHGELHRIERWFVQGTRRIVITGFGGQGKTSLAKEAGRWLLRTGLFERVCFVTYAGFEGSDPVQLLVSTLQTVLNTNLIDLAAAQAALRTTKTLLILDNLESLDPAARTELLTAATLCANQSGSRALLTARPDKLDHPDYPTSGSNSCRYLALDGLAPADALGWYRKLSALPPEPLVPIPDDALVADLFGQVGFHPLSIGVLTQLLKQQRIADLATALQARLRQDGDPLRASLNLSLARLDPDAQTVLPGLGVFKDGAFEPMLTEVLDLDESRWHRLRDALRQAGLVVVEPIAGLDQAFIRFHPSLAPVMRESLGPDDEARLSERHRSAYYGLSGELYRLDQHNPGVARVIAGRELPNLLAALFAALDQGDAQAADFADNVTRFLTIFGRTRDGVALRDRAERVAHATGSDGWYLTRSNLGEHLYRAGRFAEAKRVFDEVLRQIGETPSHRRGTAMAHLARCHEGLGQLAAAEDLLRQILRDLATLPTSRDIRRLESLIHADLGDVLWRQGDLAAAETAHQAGIKIAEELGDEHGVAVGKTQLGAIYLARGDFSRAIESYRAAIQAFDRLAEPHTVGVCYHQLGEAYNRAGDPAQAEHALREAARIKENSGDRLGAARSWMSLAVVIETQDRPVAEVEPWYRRALAVFDAEDSQIDKAKVLNNLANLLQNDPSRLTEARGLAEQAAVIKTTLDPGIAAIWQTYQILAEIADKQGDAIAARHYRAQARQAYEAAPIAREELRRHHPLIGAVLVALHQPADRPALEQFLVHIESRGWGKLVTALRAVREGAREEAALCEPLNYEDSLILHTILHCLDDPQAAQAFLASES
ncbi:MAG: tetratricopeptide repeat protein [Aliidongia sp.]